MSRGTGGTYDHLGFARVMLPRGDDGKLAAFARFQCNRCPATLDLRISDGPLDPEGYQKTARRRGWDADAFRRTRTLCPACQGRKKAAGPPRIIPVAELAAVTATISAASAEPAPPPSAQAEDPAMAATADEKPTLRELTTAEKAKVRRELDACFDDENGCFIDGHSDQSIGEKLGLPWALVTRFREAAYGPIRVDPEIAALRADGAQLRRDIEALAKAQKVSTDALAERVKAWEERMTKAIARRAGTSTAA